MWDKIKNGFAIVGAVALIIIAAILGGKPKRKLRDAAQRVRDSLGSADQRDRERAEREREAERLQQEAADSEHELDAIQRESDEAARSARRTGESNEDFIRRVRERSRESDTNGEG